MKIAPTKYHLTCIAFVLCIITSCSKKTQSTPVSADVEKYFSFSKGSYWIYKDSLSAQIDSFFVNDHYTKTLVDNNGQGTDEEIDDINTIDKYGYFSTSYLWTLVKNGILFQYNGQNNSLDFVYPFLPIGSLTSYNLNSHVDSYSVVNIYTTYDIGGLVYDSIVEYYHKQNNVFDDIIFVTKGVGVVKMNTIDLRDSSHVIWELQRCHIVH